MAITYGFFNSVSGDRKYNSDQMSAYFKGLISRGVVQNLGDGLRVSSSSGMTVSMGTGRAYFSDGKWIENDAALMLSLATADVTNPRIDRIVLRSDKTVNVRMGSVVVKTGTPNASPAAPALTNTDEIEEISLAQIRVSANATLITTANIMDERPNNAVCGFVTGLINQLDTTELFTQYQAAWNEWFTAVKADFVSATLIQQYNSAYTTVSQDETTIPINISLFNQRIDILNVFVNGLKFIEGENYIILDNTHIQLMNGLDIGQTIQFEVFKSIDATDAPDVSEALNTLQNGLSETAAKLNAATADTGWITLPLLNGVLPFLDEFPPQYRRIGNQVFIRGRVMNVTQETLYIANLPEGFRPVDYSPRWLAPCNSTIYVRLYLNGGTGNIVSEAMSDGQYPAERWIYLNYSFLID